jgi:hypothetical protein
MADTASVDVAQLLQLMDQYGVSFEDLGISMENEQQLREELQRREEFGADEHSAEEEGDSARSGTPRFVDGHWGRYDELNGRDEQPNNETTTLELDATHARWLEEQAGRHDEAGHAATTDSRGRQSVEYKGRDDSGRIGRPFTAAVREQTDRGSIRSERSIEADGVHHHRHDARHRDDRREDRPPAHPRDNSREKHAARKTSSSRHQSHGRKHESSKSSSGHHDRRRSDRRRSDRRRHSESSASSSTEYSESSEASSDRYRRRHKRSGRSRDRALSTDSSSASSGSQTGDAGLKAVMGHLLQAVAQQHGQQHPATIIAMDAPASMARAQARDAPATSGALAKSLAASIPPAPHTLPAATPLPTHMTASMHGKINETELHGESVPMFVPFSPSPAKASVPQAAQPPSRPVIRGQ